MFSVVNKDGILDVNDEEIQCHWGVWDVSRTNNIIRAAWRKPVKISKVCDVAEGVRVHFDATGIAAGLELTISAAPRRRRPRGRGKKRAKKACAN